MASTTKPSQADTTVAAEIRSVDHSAKLNAKSKQNSRKWWPFIVAPYMIGIVWHGLHPMASILTGDLANPRRLYIDENSLDPNHFKRDINYQVIKRNQHKHKAESSLCNVLRSGSHTHTMVHCSQRGELQVAKIIPTGTAIAPVSEAVVLVVPFTSDWLTSQLHLSVLHLMTRLSSPNFTPWLAKTVLLVAPTSNITLHQTVESFMSTESTLVQSPLADGALIRQVLVLDVTTASTGARSFNDSPELRILPQGRRGILPNMDLVSLCTNVYSRGLFHVISMHPYRATTRAWLTKEPLMSLPSSLKDYLEKLLELLSFEYSLVAGLIPPHGLALDQGIDSLTIQLVASNNRKRDDVAAANMVIGLEYIVRALSNLHERLHHSTSLYLLASSRTFVKHEEYLIPNLLMIVPCIVRAATLIFVDMERFSWSSARQMDLSVIVCMILVGMIGGPLLFDRGSYQTQDGSDDSIDGNMDGFRGFKTAVCGSSFFCFVTFGARWSIMSKSKSETLPKDRILTVQFFACLMVVYTHVAMAFSNVSLAFPSACVWSLLIAFPRYDRMLIVPRTALFIATILVGSQFLLSGTAAHGSLYVRYVYLPLIAVFSYLLG